MTQHNINPCRWEMVLVGTTWRIALQNLNTSKYTYAFMLLGTYLINMLVYLLNVPRIVSDNAKFENNVYPSITHTTECYVPIPIYLS